MAANSKVIVDTAAIGSAISAMQGKIEQYQSHYNQIYAILGELPRSYEGVDFDKYKTQLEGFKGDFLDLHNKLNDYVDFLRQAKSEYERVQSELVSSASKLSSDR